MSEFALSAETMAGGELVPLLTVTDLEVFLKVHRRTIQRLCDTGRLPRPLKVGGGNRWVASDVQNAIRLLAENRTEGPAEMD